MKNINAEVLEEEALEAVTGGRKVSTNGIKINTNNINISLPRYKIGQQVTVARVGATAMESGTIIECGRGYDLFHNVCWTYTIRYDNASLPDETVAEYLVSGESSVPYSYTRTDGGSENHNLL